MERPTSEKVALLERVLNRIRENARDAAGRTRFLRTAPEPKKGASVAPPAPTLALAPDQLPDATPLVASPPPAVPSPPPPAVVSRPPPAVASPPPPAVASPPPPAVASPPPAVAIVSPPPVVAGPPSAPAESFPPTDAAPDLRDEGGPPSLNDAIGPPSLHDGDDDGVPPSGPTRVVSLDALDELQVAAEAVPVAPRATQSFGQQDDVHVDVAFEDERVGYEARPPSAPPAERAAAADGNDVTGVRPIAPSRESPRPPAPPPFGAAPFEVDLASTIELPASDLASAVHSSSDEGAAAPASSPRLRSTPASVVDDDTYPAVSPSSLPPALSYESGAAAAERSLLESQVGVRPPSSAPPTPASELPPPPLRRSEMPRPATPSYHPEAEPAAASAEPQGLRMVVAPAPPAAPVPVLRPPPAPLEGFALEADAFVRPDAQGSAANFVAAVRGPAPRTFGELLDASLALGEG